MPDLLTRRSTTDLGVRLLIGVGALVAAAVHGPRPLVLALVGLALVAAADRLVAHRRRGVLDAVVLGVGGLLVTLVVVGVGLSLSPVGLTATSWGVTLSVVALVGLAASVRTAAPAAPRTGPAPTAGTRERRWPELVRLLPWGVAAGAVAVATLATSSVFTATIGRSERPSLEVAVQGMSGPSVDVAVSGAEPTGPLALRTTIDDNDIVYPTFWVDGDHAHVSRVTLPMSGRFVVALVDAEKGTELRTLVVSR